MAANMRAGTVSLGWAPSSGATGYALLRDGTTVSTVGPSVTATKVSVQAGLRTLEVRTLPAVTTTPTTTTTSTTTTVPTTTSTSPEPAPIAGQGYHLAFQDNFNTLDRSVWDDHIWYDDPPNAAWTGFQSADSSGVLHLRTSRQFVWGPTPCTGDHSNTCNWPINTATTFSSGKTFQYGYFEARMKWTSGHGAWPAFWLISNGWAKTGSCTTPSGEIDVFEGQGSEPSVFYGTVHKDSANACGGDQQNGNNYQPLAQGDLGANWHTYAALWTPTTITWYLDDQAIMSAPTYSTDNQPMFLLLQMWVGGWTFDPDSTTPDPLETQVDWVHVWQQ